MEIKVICGTNHFLIEETLKTIKENSLSEVLRIRLQTLPSSGINLFGFRVSSLLDMLHKNGFSKNEILDEIILRLGLKLSPRLWRL